jgi:hypothetical protein
MLLGKRSQKLSGCCIYVTRFHKAEADGWVLDIGSRERLRAFTLRLWGSFCCLPPTGRKFSIRPCCGPAASIGRFWSTVRTKVGRIAILQVHTRKVRLSEDAKLDEIAALTPGFTGADHANLVNEAALIATPRSLPTTRWAMPW